MEKIKAAAIQYHLVDNNNKVNIVHGHDHEYCRSYLREVDIFSYMHIMDDNFTKEGYITTDNRFVDRFEAYDIAEKAGQIIYNDENRVLKSYNVKYA